MDSTVIQEIANQLGMAVDQAWQFITENLPFYAAMKTIPLITELLISWTVFALFFVASIIALVVCRKERNKRIEEKAEIRKECTYGSGWYSYGAEDWICYLSFKAFIALGVIALICLFVATTVTCIDVPKIIGWSNYPEAMLIDMALKAVG